NERTYWVWISTFSLRTVSFPAPSLAFTTMVERPSWLIEIIFRKRPDGSRSTGSPFTLTVAPGSDFPATITRLPITFERSSVRSGGRFSPAPGLFPETTLKRRVADHSDARFDFESDATRQKNDPSSVTFTIVSVFAVSP